MEMCYNHVFIYAEFEIIYVFLKKDAQNISRRTLSIRNVFMFLLRFQFGHGNLF